MTDYRRRVLALEQAAGIVAAEVAMDAEIRAAWSEIERIAGDLDMTPDAIADEVRAGMRRRAEIGEAAYVAECAAALDIPLEVARDPEALRRQFERMDRERAEWEARTRDGQTYWRAGVAYDGHGRPVVSRGRYDGL